LNLKIKFKKVRAESGQKTDSERPGSFKISCDTVPCPMLANLIWILHVIFLIWFVITPFTVNEPMLVLHAMIAPLMMLHWVLNDDTCCLWIAECKLRGIDHKEESFFYNLISPFYNLDSSIGDTRMKQGVWLATIGLWLVTVAKIVNDPGILKRPFQKAFCDEKSERSFVKIERIVYR